MPWEPAPLDETVAALQRDVAFIVAFTCVRVLSNRADLQFAVNLRRGEHVPRGEAKFADGTTVEFQDIGAPQPGLPTMGVAELVEHVASFNLGAPLP
jgi:hypothetical protein